MPSISLHPAADRMTALIRQVGDDDLDDPTPCANLTVRGLLDHIGGFAAAFRAAAWKTFDDAPPLAVASSTHDRLGAARRHELSLALGQVADAWDHPTAWEGMTRAGGIDLPGDVAGRVALNELVVHAWDLAQSIDQRFDTSDWELEQLEPLARQLRAGDGDLPGLFGPVTPTADDAPLLDRVLALTGRNPSWRPTTSRPSPGEE